MLRGALRLSNRYKSYFAACGYSLYHRYVALACASRLPQHERVPRARFGLSIFALMALSIACGDSKAPPAGRVSPRSDGGPDSGIDGGPPDAAVDAADAASPRGEKPEWPEAEQEIELPYRGAATSRLLIFEASPKALDLQLNIDTTSSIRNAIDELQAALRTDVIQPL